MAMEGIPSGSAQIQKLGEVLKQDFSTESGQHTRHLIIPFRSKPEPKHASPMRRVTRETRIGAFCCNAKGMEP